VVGLVVDREFIFLAFERELPLGDAIGDSAHGAAEVLIPVGLVACHVVETEDNVGELALLIGDV